MRFHPPLLTGDPVGDPLEEALGLGGRSRVGLHPRHIPPPQIGRGRRHLQLHFFHHLARRETQHRRRDNEFAVEGDTGHIETTTTTTKPISRAGNLSTERDVKER